MKSELKVKLIAHTPNPDEVVAKAAKLCYSKIGIEDMNVTEEEATKFVNRLASMGHCYDDKTEVLTSEGFKMWKDVDDKDSLACFNPEDSSFEAFEKPLKLIKNKVKEDLLIFNHRHASLAITQNHKLYVSVSNSQENRKKPIYKLRYASELLPTGKMVWQSPIRMKNSAININTHIDDKDNLFKLYGFFIGDGYARPNTTEKTKNISFHLIKDRKVDYLSNICSKIGIAMESLANNKYKVNLDNLDMTTKDFRDMFYNQNNQKTFSVDFFKMTKTQFDNFLEGLLESDGDYNGKHKNDLYLTSSQELANRLQILCSLNGRPCSLRSSALNEHILYRIYIMKEGKDSLMFNDSRRPGNIVTKKHYEGYVYCATVSTGLLMIRREGKILLSGNSSPIEHVSFTFAIEGVSRSLTHQLVRHRLASYSQQSQRYVKLDQFEYVIPPRIAENNMTKKYYIEAMEKAQKTYDDIYSTLLIKQAEHLGLIDAYSEYTIKEINKDKMHEVVGLEEFWINHDKDLPRNERQYSKIQKQIIEDCRYVFPNACETKICVTMNARTLMNFFHHRCCERAQWEIRELADEMCKAVKKMAPALFSKAGPSCVAGACPEGAMSCGQVKEMREKFLDN